MRLPALPVAALVVGAMWLMMLVELQLSSFNERHLRARGAVEPHDDVLPLMRVAYPGVFLLMGLEAMQHGSIAREWVAAGLLALGAVKAFKFWTLASLGARWTYRVLVLPDAPLVTAGPYRFIRHPNYVAVMGEIVAVAIALAAPVAGVVGAIGFGWLLRRRIAVEERALGIR